jgi:hypothetical protein
MTTRLLASVAALGLLAGPVMAATPAKAPAKTATSIKTTKHAKHAKKNAIAAAATTKAK